MKMEYFSFTKGAPQITRGIPVH